MYELFVMPLKEYWTEDDVAQGAENVATLQKDLSELFGHEVSWDEPETVASSEDEEDEIDIAAFTDIQFDALQALAAALEMGKTADDLSFDEDGIVDPEIFESFAEYADENDVKRFPQLLWLGHSMESFMIPPDFDQVVEVGDTDDECDCGCDHDHDDDDCCCEDDTSSIDVASIPAVRRELDDMAKVLDLKSDLSLDDIETVEFDDDDLLREAKVAWYILNARINEAIKSKLPLIMRFTDDDDDEDAFDDDVDKD